MQRILNDADYVVDDMLKGFVKAHSDLVRTTENPRVLLTANPPKDRPAVVTGGGSGHKPAFIGYIGKNMCDAAAVGEIFSSPPVTAFHDAFKAADCGHGVACLYGTYSGDNMNVKMAIKLAAKEGITVKTVIANDDVPSAPRGRARKAQRGRGRGADVESRLGEGLPWREPRRGNRGGAKGHRQHEERRYRANSLHFAGCWSS